MFTSLKQGPDLALIIWSSGRAFKTLQKLNLKNNLLFSYTYYIFKKGSTKSIIFALEVGKPVQD